MAPASEPPTTEPTTHPAAAAAGPAVVAGVIEQLLLAAEASSSPRVQALASRIRELVAEMEGRLETAAQEAEAEQQVAQLRQQLAEAEQRLRTLRWGDSSLATQARSAAPVSTAASTGVSAEEMRAARQWALANGVECSTTGRVAARVIDAWRAATPADTAGGGA